MSRPRHREVYSFIGVDLAWKVDGNNSGVAVLTGDHASSKLTVLGDAFYSLDAVVDFIRTHAAGNAVVASDCPLVVTNASGQRTCERALSQIFGRYGAGAHSTNLGRPFADTGPRLVAALHAHGFRYRGTPPEAEGQPGRWMFEVYPHPAMIRLFNLQWIIRYKNWPVAQRRQGLRELQCRLLSLCNQNRGLDASPLLDGVLTEDPATLRGAGLKRLEDRLDAVFCAYLAWHCWRWGATRNEAFGSAAEGCIVVPTGHDEIS